MLGFTKSKPKKDIEKRPAGKSRISIFFEIFFRKFWSICKLNMLFSLIAIPAFVILFFITGILSASITDFITNTIIPRLGSDTDIELFKIYRLVPTPINNIIFIIS